MTGGLTLGIDIGGTKTALALIDPANGRIAARDLMATPPRDKTGRGFLARLAQAADRLCPEPAAVGIGLCELVTPEGLPASAHRVDLQGLAAADVFAARFRVVFESDVRAAAVAEAVLGAGRPYREFVYVNAGTGLSSTWVRERIPHAGRHGAALVLGTGPLAFRCVACGEPQEIAPESIAGAQALLDRYRACGGEAASAGDVVNRAAAGDRRAETIVTEAAWQAGSAAGWLVNVLDPDAVVAGGGLVAAGGHYWDAFQAGLARTRWTGAPRPLPVLRAALGPDAGVIGAALVAARRFS